MKPLLLILLLASSSFAQSDSVSRHPDIQDTVTELGVLTQLGFSTAAFLVGYIPDGYSHIDRQLRGEWGRPISVIITPFLTSAATDFAKSHFWQLDDHDGSYFAGVLGGFIGQLTASLLHVALRDSHTYTTVFISYLVPTVLFTTLFYNYFGR